MSGVQLTGFNASLNAQSQNVRFAGTGGGAHQQSSIVTHDRLVLLESQTFQQIVSIKRVVRHMPTLPSTRDVVT